MISDTRLLTDICSSSHGLPVRLFNIRPLTSCRSSPQPLSNHPCLPYHRSDALIHLYFSLFRSRVSRLHSRLHSPIHLTLVSIPTDSCLYLPIHPSFPITTTCHASLPPLSLLSRLYPQPRSRTLVSIHPSMPTLCPLYARYVAVGVAIVCLFHAYDRSSVRLHEDINNIAR
jgi:hypothetical protein